MKKILDFMQAVPLFSTIKIELIEDIVAAGNCFMHAYPKGKVIHIQHEKCQYMDYILSGVVTVQALDASGNIMTISDFTVGEALGSNLLFSSHPSYPMTVLAKTEVSLLHIHSQAIVRLCGNSQKFLLEFLRQVSDKTLILTGKINSVAMKCMRDSILDFLKMECKLQNSNCVVLPFSKKEWAELLGVQRPSLSRELNHMRQDGLIAFDKRTITLLTV